MWHHVQFEKGNVVIDSEKANTPQKAFNFKIPKLQAYVCETLTAETRRPSWTVTGVR